MIAIRCNDCQGTGRIRILMQIGEYSHQREEYCSCAIGRKLLEASQEPTDLESPGDDEPGPVLQL